MRTSFQLATTLRLRSPTNYTPLNLSKLGFARQLVVPLPQRGHDALKVLGHQSVPVEGLGAAAQGHGAQIAPDRLRVAERGLG